MTDHWNHRIPLAAVGRVARAALAEGHLDDTAPAALFHDLGRLRRRLERVRTAFPPDTLHAVAIKANPLVEVLRCLVAAGAGLEAASFEEAHLALAAGCPPSHVVYDSPAKTRAELAEALRLGLYLNLDNLDELSRVAALGPPPGHGPIGLRVNPMVGAGRIALTSVAARGSKFGVPLDTGRGAIVEAFARFPWLTGLHVHTGSQGCAVDLLASGVARVETLRAELGPGRVRWLDLGGGLPVAYRPDEQAPTPEDYVAALRRAAPGALAGGPRLVTELGRALQAPCGFALSRVEYVKDGGDRPTVVVHVGADLLLRVAYRPGEWHHELAVLDTTGCPRGEPPTDVRVVGPLCFGGDVLAESVALPLPRPGDLLVVHDVGAYTLGMWSRHCSRGMPPVLGYEDAAAPALRVLRRRERPEDIVTFWSR